MNQETLQLTGGSGKQKRRALDFYPTPNEATIALMDFLKLDSPQTIWECACGTGQMANVLKSYGHHVIETDITTGDDYLKTFHHSDAIITNPPFNLSQLFIEKAIKETRLVAMLLKSQYWHAAKRLPLFETNPPTYILPLTWRVDFLQHERKIGDKKGAPTMEVAWSVWVNSVFKKGTQYIPLKKPYASK